MFDDDDGVAPIHQRVQHREQPADIVEVEACGRFVEEVERLSGGAFGELARELDALGLAAGERRRRLAEMEIVETDRDQRVENPHDLGHRCKQIARLADREIEDLRDVETLVVNLEGLAVVAATGADIAGDEDIRQKVHLDPDLARALAGLAPTPLDVEAEPARFVSTGPRIGGRGEQRSDGIEDLGVGRRVRSRSAADGRLVDADDLVEVFPAGHRLVFARPAQRPEDLAGNRLVQHFVDQGRLPRPRNPRDTDQPAQGKVDVDVLQVVLGGAADDQPLSVSVGPHRRHRDAFSSRQIRPGQRRFVLDDALGGTGGDHLAAETTGARSQVDHPVRVADGLLVVLDDDHGVAEIPHALEGVEQTAVVALVETDGRLVEDVQHTHQFRSDLGREPDPLALAAGQRSGHPVEGEVVEADRDQESEPVADFPEDLRCDVRVAFVEPETIEPVHGPVHRQGRDIRQAGAFDLHRQTFRSQPGAVTGVARRERHVPFELAAHSLGRGLLVAPLQSRDDAFKTITESIGALAALPDEVVLFA